MARNSNKNLSKSQKNQIRLLRGAASVSVQFNGYPVKIARSSAIYLVEVKAARVNATLHMGEDLRVSLEAIAKDEASS